VNYRAFEILLHPRGRRALEEAGFDVAAFLKTNQDTANPAAAAAPGPPLHGVSSLASGGGSRLEEWLVPYSPPRLAGTRHAFCAAMAAQAQAMPLPIHWHWQTSFEALDLAAQRATFCTEARQHGGGSPRGGAAFELPYDLLIAADGATSRVRRAAAAQLPALAVTVQPSECHYKVFSSLPADPAFGPGKLRTLRSAAGCVGTAVFYGLASSVTGACAGFLSLERHCWEGVESAADHERLLAERFPALPEAWRRQVRRVLL
jgi:2-polyprenyl-6-methoxyphenol hydroxylase-like FAD-dependent oxidoreductase